MTVKLDFEECLRDSPWFRAAVEEAEAEVSELETQLEKVLKLGGAVLEAGRQLVGSSRALAVGLREMGGAPRRDPLLKEALEKLCDSLEQMMDGHEELQDSTERALRRHLHGLMEGCRVVRGSRRERGRAVEALGAALQHHAEVPRRRPHEAQEAAAAMGGARGVARARGLDHVMQLNVMQDKQKTEMLQFALSLLAAHASFFSHGHTAAASSQPFRTSLGTQLEQMELEAARRHRDLEQRHALLLQQDLTQEVVDVASGGAGPDAPPMEGYLYKRASNAFRTWSRRWFSIQSNQLVYHKRAQDPPTVVVPDLRLCTVKPCPELERRFCFEVVSPNKSCVLQADSAGQQRAWVSAVQSSIASAFSQDPPPGPTGPPGSTSGSGGSHGGREVLGQILGLEGNGNCCECSAPDPAWASVNLGITLCIECSGIHRSLGVHFSKVRSLTLDTWEPELVKLMCELGNRTLNRIYEARVEEMGVKKPHPECSRVQREDWIRAKYVEKKFVTRLPGAWPKKPRPPRHVSRGSPAPRGSQATEPEPPPSLHPGALLYWGAQHRRLPAMADALAHGADPGWANVAEEHRTPLLQAVAVNSLLGCEFLLQNGANVNQRDSRGRGPLHHATMLGHTGLVCLFLKRGADINAVDAEGKDALTIAMELANADIVTLLRLAKMRELDVAQGQTGDDTYLDIFRDISLMASDNPEKLTRAPSKHSTL
ncbi:arf-GAP with coiled-coil, ANK repeat and PH domain-containing protein 1 isoform X1 [Gallus gallus]|uniref:arf-GAP with coiled-coil, ANK repeat and PH domain-containing protein 1 isoform X1 n=1 Tax=Gallus gallus TaxID=9031 RepID=UPI001AE5231C|nr:arf-GAP with coiled-coil, ANK repeat and PH domain-containing protein 1 isoform X1 [Gallus gallus]